MNTILIILLVALFIGLIAIALVKSGKIQDTDGDLTLLLVHTHTPEQQE